MLLVLVTASITTSDNESRAAAVTSVKGGPEARRETVRPKHL